MRQEAVHQGVGPGEQNRSPSSLPELAEHGAEIPHSGHWPMYANAPELWRRITAFLHRTGSGDDWGRRPS